MEYGFRIITTQPETHETLHVVLLGLEFESIFIAAGLAIELRAYRGHYLELTAFICDVGTTSKCRWFKEIKGQFDIVVTHEDIFDDSLFGDRRVQYFCSCRRINNHYVIKGSTISQASDANVRLCILITMRSSKNINKKAGISPCPNICFGT